MSAPSDLTGLLALQRTAGNVAVARWLAQDANGTAATRAASRSRPAARALSRSEAGEHAQYGGDEKVLVNGVAISKGNIIAMADFFRTPEEMNAADPQVLRRLDAAITQDRGARTGQKGPGREPLTPPANDELQKITEPLGEGNTYMDLNKANEAHFAPPATGAAAESRDHRSQFEKLHRQALDEAHEAAPQMSVDPSKAAAAPGAGPPLASVAPPAPPAVSEPEPLGPVLDAKSPAAKPPAAASVPANAVATNMFAAHFLTDAFAAGHLVNKQAVLAQAREAWARMETSGAVLKENSFTKQVAARVVRHPDVTAKLANMQMINLRAIGIGAGIGGVAGAVAGAGVASAAGAIGGAAAGGAVGSAVAGYGDVTAEHLSELLHLTSRLDPGSFFNIFARMVHDKLNRVGVEVSNGEETWQLSGDGTLNAKSLEIGRRAVAESERNLEEAARTSGGLPYDAMIARVWKLVPQPTEKGKQLIDTVRDDLTNAADPAAVDEAVELSVKEIATAIDQMIKMKILRPKPGTAPATGTAGGKAQPTSAAPSPPSDAGTPASGGVPAGVP